MFMGDRACVLVLTCWGSYKLGSRLLECLLVDGTLASCNKSEICWWQQIS